MGNGWLYAVDGDSSLHVIDLDSPVGSAQTAWSQSAGAPGISDSRLITLPALRRADAHFRLAIPLTVPGCPSSPYSRVRPHPSLSTGCIREIRRNRSWTVPAFRVSHSVLSTDRSKQRQQGYSGQELCEPFPASD